MSKFVIVGPDGARYVFKAETINVVARGKKVFVNDTPLAEYLSVGDAREAAEMLTEELDGYDDEYFLPVIHFQAVSSSIPTIRAMSTMPPEEFCPKLIRLLADNGVAIIFLPFIKGSLLHGASFYDGNKIVVGLTVRGKYADVFWFSLFHEIAHIIYGHIGQANGTSETDENKANLFARETLIPSSKLQSFIQTGVFTTASLKEFAESINIDVGILVGRLQHDDIIGYQQFTRLKKKYELKQ